jgi:hypothetical protein
LKAVAGVLTMRFEVNMDHVRILLFFMWLIIFGFVSIKIRNFLTVARRSIQNRDIKAYLMEAAKVGLLILVVIAVGGVGMYLLS